MAKTIVTHVSPDFDGIGAIWLFSRFHPDFSNFRLDFVPAGQTLGGKAVDSDPDIVHVDTGGGKFDHHNTDDFTCAAQLVLESLIKEGYIKEIEKDAVSRMVTVVNETDHGWDNYKWHEPAEDKYEFMVHNVLFGRKQLKTGDDKEQIDWGLVTLDAIYQVMKSKIQAEKEISAAKKFKTRWGEALAVQSGNSTILDLAIKMGMALSVLKDPNRGNVRITGSNILNVDLTNAYEAFLKADPEATWYLHPSKVLLRNGSTRNPTMKATKLRLEQIIEILEKV